MSPCPPPPQQSHHPSRTSHEPTSTHRLRPSGNRTTPASPLAPLRHAIPWRLPNPYQGPFLCPPGTTHIVDPQISAPFPCRRPPPPPLPRRSPQPPSHKVTLCTNPPLLTHLDPRTIGKVGTISGHGNITTTLPRTRTLCTYISTQYLCTSTTDSTALASMALDITVPSSPLTRAGSYGDPSRVSKSPRRCGPRPPRNTQDLETNGRRSGPFPFPRPRRSGPFVSVPIVRPCVSHESPFSRYPLPRVTVHDLLTSGDGLRAQSPSPSPHLFEDT